MGNVGTLFITVAADASGVARGLSKAEQTLERFGSRLFFMGNRITAGVTLPLVALMGAVTKWGSEFDKAMTESLAIADKVSTQMRDKMAARAMEISEMTSFSAAEVAKAYYPLISAGLDAQQALDSVGTVADFAQAGLLNIDTAAGFLTASVKALGTEMIGTKTETEAMARVADVLTKANNLSRGTVETFAKALTTKSAVAGRMYKVTLEELVGALMVFHSKGVEAQTAGQNLWMVLRDLQTATQRNVEKWKAFGVSVYDANKQMRPLAAIVHGIELRFAGFSAAQVTAMMEGKKAGAALEKQWADMDKTSAMLNLGFQDRSRASLMVQLTSYGEMKEKGTDLIQNIKDITASYGEAARVRAEQMKSFVNTMATYYHVLQNQFIRLFNDIRPIFERDVLPVISQLLEKIRDLVTWFGKLSPEVKKWTIYILAAAAAFGPLLAVLGSMTLFISGMIGAVSMLGKAFVGIVDIFTRGKVGAVLTAMKQAAMPAGKTAVAGGAWANVSGAFSTLAKTLPNALLLLGKVYLIFELIKPIFMWFINNTDKIRDVFAAITLGLSEVVLNVLGLSGTKIDWKSILNLGEAFGVLDTISTFLGMFWGTVIDETLDFVASWGKSMREAIALQFKSIGLLFTSGFWKSWWTGNKSFVEDQIAASSEMWGPRDTKPKPTSKLGFGYEQGFWNQIMSDFQHAGVHGTWLGPIDRLVTEARQGAQIPYSPAARAAQAGPNKTAAEIALQKEIDRFNAFMDSLFGPGTYPDPSGVPQRGASAGKGGRESPAERIKRELDEMTANIQGARASMPWTNLVDEFGEKARELAMRAHWVNQEVSREISEVARSAYWKEFSKSAEDSVRATSAALNKMTGEEAQRIINAHIYNTNTIRKIREEERDHAIKTSGDEFAQRKAMLRIWREEQLIDLQHSSRDWEEGEAVIEAAFIRRMNSIEAEQEQSLADMANAVREGPWIDAWIDTLDRLSGAFRDLAQVTGGLSGAAEFLGTIVSSMKLGAEAGKEIQGGLGDIIAGGDWKGLTRLSVGAISAYAAMAQATDQRTAAERVIGGAMTGASAGAAFGHIGAAVGAAVGALVGALRNPKWAQAMSRVGHDWGVEITEELARTIADDAKKLFKGSMQAAEIFNLGKILSEAGGLKAGNIGTFMSKLRDIFVMMETGAFTAAQGMAEYTDQFGQFADFWIDKGIDVASVFSEQMSVIWSFLEAGKITTSQVTEFLDKNFGKFAESFEKSGRIASRAFADLIDKYRALKLESKIVTDFLIDQGKKAADAWAIVITGIGAGELDDYANKIIGTNEQIDELQKKIAMGEGDIETLTRELNERLAYREELMKRQNELAEKHGAAVERMGSIVLYTFNQMISAGVGWSQALKTIEPALDKLIGYYDALGIEVENTGLAELIRYRNISKANEALFAAAENFGLGAVALSSMGKISQETFNTMQVHGVEMYERVREAVEAMGGSAEDALRPMIPWLTAARDIAAEYGLELDENTQKLIAEAEKYGLLKPRMDTLEESMYKVATAMEEVAYYLEQIATKIFGLPTRRDIDINLHYNQTGNPPDEPDEPPQAPGTPEVPDIPQAARGIYASGRRGVATWFGEGGEPELGGPRDFMAGVLSDAMKMAGASAGGGDIHVTLVMPDGDVLLKQVIKAGKQRGML